MAVAIEFWPYGTHHTVLCAGQENITVQEFNILFSDYRNKPFYIYQPQLDKLITVCPVHCSNLIVWNKQDSTFMRNCTATNWQGVCTRSCT